MKSNVKKIAKNNKAHFNYFIEETVEAGISLVGTEVKSIRDGKINIGDSYGKIIDNEVFLFNCNIAPYSHGNLMNHDPLRNRKLLLHRREINRLIGKIQMQGYTLLPISVYLKDGKIKLELGLGKGKKLYDKREDLKKRDVQREIEKTLKNR